MRRCGKASETPSRMWQKKCYDVMRLDTSPRESGSEESEVGRVLFGYVVQVHDVTTGLHDHMGATIIS